jgi:hypothetical protein
MSIAVVVVLPCEPTTATSFFALHDLGEHFAPTHLRQAQRGGAPARGMRGRDGRRMNDQLGVIGQSARDGDSHAGLFQQFAHGRIPAVVLAADAKAEPGQIKAQRGHAHAAGTEQVHMRHIPAEH